MMMNTLFKTTIRNKTILSTRAYQPTIKFIGKRSKSKYFKRNLYYAADKGIGIHDKPRERHAAPVADAPKVAAAPAGPRALSPNCSVRVEKDWSVARYRLKYSKEEIEVINSGGSDQVGDWRKIKI